MDNDKEFNPQEPETDFSADLITLTDEDGVNHEFELVDTLEHKGNSYVALIASYADDPAKALEGDGDLVIMKVVSEESEDEILEIIEDDDEFDEISDIFLNRLGDLFDFDSDEDDEED